MKIHRFARIDLVNTFLEGKNPDLYEIKINNGIFYVLENTNKQPERFEK